jgi:hypothetical protein
MTESLDVLVPALLHLVLGGGDQAAVDLGQVRVRQ